MDFILTHTNFFLAAWLAMLFLLERLNKNHADITQHNRTRWFKNGLFGVMNRLLGPIVMLPIAIWATSIHLWLRPAYLSSWIITCADIIILDLMNYWFHRLSHSSSLLWRFHEIHHLDSKFDSTTGLRIRKLPL